MALEIPQFVVHGQIRAGIEVIEEVLKEGILQRVIHHDACERHQAESVLRHLLAIKRKAEAESIIHAIASTRTPASQLFPGF